MLVAANHFSGIDHPLIGAFSPRPLYFMAKAELFEIPVIGEILGWTNTFPIRRGEADREGVRRARELVREGKAVVVHIEGTRQPFGHPGPIQRGALLIALAERVPVVPCAVDTFGWSPLNRRRCAVVFGEPLSFEGLPRGRAGYDQAGSAVEAAIVSSLAAGGRRRPRRLPRAAGRRRAPERPVPAAGAAGEPATLTVRGADDDAEPRPPVRDRPGRGPARVRLLLRVAQADRPPARPQGRRGGERRGDPLGARPAPARDARRARPDLRQVRPGPLDAAGHRPAGHHRRAPQAPGRRAPVPVRGRRAHDPRGARPLDRAALPRVRRAAGRRRLDRPGAPRGAPERPPGRGQGAAAERAAARSTPTSRCSTRPRGSRRSACARSTSSTRARSSTSSRARSARSSTTASRPATPRRFHRNFAGHPHVRVPRVYWSYTRARVLTLEFLDGVQLADLPLDEYTLEQRRRLAYLLTEAWMHMIFRHGFFHGDPHPANILVLDPEQIGLVDFGQVGKLTDDDMSKLTRLFIAAANEQIEELPRRLADLGVRYPKEREEEFVAELREIFNRYYGSNLGGDRPDPGHPRGVPAHLLAQPAPADALRAARQGDRDARLGRHRPVPGLQRVRGREAVRAEPDAASGTRRSGSRSGRGARRSSSPTSRASCRTRSTTCSSRCATARSRSASSTRASTT